VNVRLASCLSGWFFVNRSRLANQVAHSLSVASMPLSQRTIPTDAAGRVPGLAGSVTAADRVHIRT
jgi:hypothetical protein